MQQQHNHLAGGEPELSPIAAAGKHTPGPWQVAGKDRADQRIVRGEHIEICTCWHHSVIEIEREMEANARLIAAAPELLEALQAIVLEVSEGHRPHSTDSYLPPHLVDAARDALAKAGAA